MKIVPMETSSINKLPTAQSSTPAPVSPRERAIAALMGNPSQEAPPVPNATRVSPEEMGAIRPPSRTTGQNVTNEDSSVASEAPKAETKVSSEPLSSHYAVMARREKALRHREDQLKAREAALTPKAEEKSSQPSFDPSKYIDRERLTKSPFEVLNELGLSYDQLTELAMNAPNQEQMTLMNDVKSMREELNRLKGEAENTKKSFEENQTAQRQQAISQIKNEVKSLIKHDPNFETIRETNSISSVVELIERTFDEDGILLTVEDAAQQVEEHLTEKALRLAKLGKIQRRMAPPAPAAAPSAPTNQTSQQIKTLTNSVGSTRPMSARERAIAAMQGKLK